jgi:hypothetical protein
LDDDGNLVTACQACQYGRGRHALEEFGLSDPRERPPVVDDWDGLTRLLRKPETGGRQPRVTRRTGLSPAEWFAALDAIWPTASTRLTAFIESCADLDVRWTLNEVLLIKAVVRGETLSVVGVKSDGLCEIPWSIGTAKESCRTFAEKLTEGIPGTVAYETRKTWSVSKPGKKRLDVIELLDAAPALRLALEALRSEEHVAAD